MSRPKSKIHRPNGPYLPVGDLGGEYCVKCRQSWPCPDAPTEEPEQEYTIEKCGGLTVYHPVGSQYPDLQPPKPEPLRLRTIDEMVKRTDLPLAA